MSGRIFEIPQEHVDNVYNNYTCAAPRIAICQEELGELIQAISKYVRYVHNEPGFEYTKCRGSIVEELTHVAIVLGMLSKMFEISVDEIEAEVRRKAEKSDFDMSNYSWQFKHRGIYDIPKYVTDANGLVVVNPEWLTAPKNSE